MSRPATLLTAVLALCLLAACGGDDTPTAPADEETTPAAAPEDDAATEDAPADEDAEGDDTAAADDGATEAAAAGDAGEACSEVDLTAAPDEPVTIRIGHGAAAEEPFWLMTVDPSLTEHQGTFYEMELTQFRGTEERLVAYQAGELDAVLISPQAQIRGEATGSLDLYAIVTVMREADPDAFSTSFVTLEETGITSLEDLLGKRIAVVDIGSQLDFLARAGVTAGGGDPDTDATYVVFPFPAQTEALLGGQIDVAGLPEPFYTMALAEEGVTHVFNAADITDFAYDLLTISFDRDFVEEHVAAVCAFVEDYQAAMAHYRAETEEAKRALAASDFIPLPEDLYLATGDYARPADGVVDVEGMELMLEEMIEFGILTEDDRVDLEALVRPGITAGH